MIIPRLNMTDATKTKNPINATIPVKTPHASTTLIKRVSAMIPKKTAQMIEITPKAPNLYLCSCCSFFFVSSFRSSRSHFLNSVCCLIFSTATGSLSSSSSFEPQYGQKRTSPSFSIVSVPLHCLHFITMLPPANEPSAAVPHSGQNFTLSGISAPHFLHFDIRLTSELSVLYI